MAESPSEPTAVASAEVRVGPWQVQPQLGRIRRDGKQRRLEPKLIELLCYFAAHPRQVLSKQKLVDAVWDGRFLSDSALTRSISELRSALEDDAQSPRFIETIPKRGYRLVAPVERGGASAVAAGSGEQPSPSVVVWAGRWPSWLALVPPDGESLAVELASPGGYQLGIVPAAGGALRRLSDEPGAHWPGGFSPDGRRVVFAASRRGVWSLRWIDVGGSTEVEIAGGDDLAVYYRYPVWSPRGDQIVAERAELGLDLWQVGLE